MTKGLLLDLDDTLYPYPPCEDAARAALCRALSPKLDIAAEDVLHVFTCARDAVKDRNHTPSAHSRLLYLAQLVYAEGKPWLLAEVRALESLYWDAYLSAARLHPGVDALLALRDRGFRIAIVTDLTLDVQLRKLEHFRLFDRIDALVASEEVGRDKPAADIFELAASRIGVPLPKCVMVGDNLEKDGKGARGLGIPFLHARAHGSREGQTLEAIVALLEGS